MKILNADIKGPVRIHVVETEEDLPGFYQFIKDNSNLGFDTETTGLDWWNAGNGFHCRLAQFGNWDTSWVIPVELGEVFKQAARWALNQAKKLTAHNRGFDTHVSEADLGVDALMMAKKTLCSKILAHLVDSRAVKEGGIGLKLEELVPHYIDAEVGAAVKKSMVKIASRYKVEKLVNGVPKMVKCNKETIWPVVDLFDEEYLLYAGMDPIFAFRLTRILSELIPTKSLKAGLVSWEHRGQWITYQVERTGYLVDEPYTAARIEELKAEEVKWLAVVEQYGVENAGSNAQLIEAFQGFGVVLDEKNKTKPTERHPEGQYKMDDSVLSSIEHPLAEAVIKYKSAHKKRTSWFEKILNSRDKNGRIHASINSLQARTARMSVTGAFPAQTLPAGTGYVRSCLLAEPGHVSVAVDFSSMELMFLAADSGDKVMMRAYLNGEDLHSLTAAAAFGDMGWDPSGPDKHPKRKAGKGTNYTVCFGGGWNAVSTQWDIEEKDAKAAVAGFWKAYPSAKVLKERCQGEATRNGFIYTVTGRRILTDDKRPYAGMNYRIQSSCRDITMRALMKLDKAGFTPYIRMIVHDEVVFSFPKDRAEELGTIAARLMEFTYKGLKIPADLEVGEQSWGSVLDGANSKH